MALLTAIASIDTFEKPIYTLKCRPPVMMMITAVKMSVSTISI